MSSERVVLVLLRFGAWFALVIGATRLAGGSFALALLIAGGVWFAASLNVKIESETPAHNGRGQEQAGILSRGGAARRREP